MPLPGWLEKDKRFAEEYMNGQTEFEKRLVKALEIAVEALEVMKKNCSNHSGIPETALSKIEALGKVRRS